MDETQVKSPKLCFSADLYLVYGIRRDSRCHFPVMAARVPAIHVSRFADIQGVDAAMRFAQTR